MGCRHRLAAVGGGDAGGRKQTTARDLETALVNDRASRLLAAHEPGPVESVRAHGASPFVLVCEHAGNRAPQRLDRLGLPDREWRRHIAWDIGAADVARRMSAQLDAPLVLQTYSRLVIDCNRPPCGPLAIPAVSDHTTVPGNRDLAPAEAALRRSEIFEPFHGAVAATLDARAAAGRESVLVTVHSFTPVYDGATRPWHVSVQYNRDPQLSRILMALLARDAELCVGDNTPYPVDDETHYTIPVHGEARGIPHAMIEIRQDLVSAADGQAAWADRLSAVLRQAHERLRRAAE